MQMILNDSAVSRLCEFLPWSVPDQIRNHTEKRARSEAKWLFTKWLFNSTSLFIRPTIAGRVALAIGLLWALFVVTTFVALTLISRQGLETEARLITIYLGIMAGIGGVIGAVAAIAVLRGIVVPVRKLTVAVEAISRGEFDAPLDLEGDDELKTLALTIKTMGARRRDAENRLKDLAHQDSLTNLPNRTLFHLRLTEAINNARRAGHKVGVLLLDLDHFKNINDTLGHFAGDELLQEVAERLLGCVRSTDTVARLGGDEFAIIQNHLKDDMRVEMLAQRITRRLASPISLAGDQVHTGASIGITVYPADGDQSDDLLRKADLALYRAKDEGRGSYYLYDLALDKKVKERAALESEFRKALATRDLFVVYQPKADLKTGRIVGAEALIRWRHPEYGMVSPGKFVPIAEQTGLILQMTEFVLEQVGADIRNWPYNLPEDFRMSVNLSAFDLKREDFVGWMRDKLIDCKIDPSHLELEITERALISDDPLTQTTLTQLRQLGIHLAIDDFGMGYSSLNYLKQIPLDCLKIDKSFVSDINTDRTNASIAKSVITMAQGMGMRVVAEGVEGAEQVSFLAHEGCDEIQGYFLSAELSIEQFLLFYSENQQNLRFRAALGAA
jgi:diguanylate cyclase (GGDEF)-like protein